MVIEAFSSHLLSMLFLPLFTLNYVSGNLSKKDDKSIELKIKRKLKRESNLKLSVPEDPSLLYDADDDLIDHSDDDNQKLRPKQFSLQLNSNLASWTRALYI